MTIPARILATTALCALGLPLAACTHAQEPDMPSPAAEAQRRTADMLPPKPAFEEMLGAFDSPAPRSCADRAGLSREALRAAVPA